MKNDKGNIKFKNRWKILLGISTGTVIIGAIAPIISQVAYTSQHPDSPADIYDQIEKIKQRQSDAKSKAALPSPAVSSFDMWWASNKQKSVNKPLAMGIPPSLLNVKDISDTNSPIYNSVLAEWISKQPKTNKTSDQLTFYVNSMPVEKGVSIPSTNKNISFKLSTPSKIATDAIDFSITWSKNANEVSSETYWSNVQTQVGSMIKNFTGPAPDTISIYDIRTKMLNDIADSGVNLPAKLVLLDSSKKPFDGDTISIPKDKRTIEFNLGYPENGISGKLKTLVNNIKVTYSESQNEYDERIFWEEHTADNSSWNTRAMSTAFPDPNKSFGISDAKVNQIPHGVTSSWIMLPSPFTSIPTTPYTFQVPKNKKVVEYYTAYQFKNFTGSPSSILSDYSIYPGKMEWNDSFYEFKAKQSFDIIKKTNKSLQINPGTPKSKYILSDVLLMLGLSQNPAGEGQIELWDTSSNKLPNGISVADSDNSISFKLAIPENGPGSNYLTSTNFTITWSDSINSQKVKGWFNNKPNINDVRQDLSPTGGLTIQWLKDNEQSFNTWYNNKPSNLSANIELWSGGSAVNSIPIGSNHSANFTLKYPNDGIGPVNNANSSSYSQVTGSVTWAIPGVYYSKIYWDKVTKALNNHTTITRSGTAPASISFNDFKKWFTLPTKDSHLKRKLKLYDMSGNKQQNINVPKNQKSISFTIRFPRDDNDWNNTFQSNLITITWGKTNDEGKAEVFWKNTVLNKLHDKNYTSSPSQLSFQIVDIIRILSLPSINSGFSNYFLIPATQSSGNIYSSSTLTLPNNSKKLEFKIAYPKNGKSGSNYSDFFVSPSFKFTWTKTKNEADAKTYFDNVRNKILSSITNQQGAPNSSYAIQDIKNMLGLGSIAKPSSISSQLTFITPQGTPASSISIPKTFSSFQFEIGFPKNGVSGSVRNDFHTYQFTLTWAQSMNGKKSQDWWNTAPGSNIPTIYGTPDTQITINDLMTNNKFGLTNWFSNKDSSLDDPKFNSGNNNITIADNQKSVTFTLKYPKSGLWSQGSNYLTKSFTISWSKTRDEIDAQAYWDIINNKNSSQTIGQFPNNQIDWNFIKSKLGLHDPKSGFSIPEIWDSTGTKVSSITVPNTEKKVTFALWFAKDGKRIPNGNFTKTFIFSWTQTKNEHDINSWWTPPSTWNPINVGSMSVAPTHISLSDFTNGTFSTISNWYSNKPGFAGNKLELWANGRQISGNLSIPANSKNITIDLKFPEDGTGTTSNTNKLSHSLQISWGKTVDEKQAEDYWALINALPSTTSIGPNNNPPANYNLTNAIRNFHIPAIPNMASGNPLNLSFEHNGSTSASIGDADYSLRFNIKLPNNGVSGASYSKQFIITWAESRNVKKIHDWWNSIPTAPQLGGAFTPDTWSLQDIQTLITQGNPVPVGNMRDIKVKFNGSNINGNNPSKNTKQFTFNITFLKDGTNSNRGTVTRQFKVYYTKTNNEQKSDIWFHTLSANNNNGNLIQGPPPTMDFSLANLKNNNLIKNILSKYPQLTANLVFTDASGSIISSPKINEEDSSVDFYLSFPKDGVSNSGGLFSPIHFTYSWSKTTIQARISNWFNNIKLKTNLPTNGTNDYPSNSYSQQDILNWLNTGTIPQHSSPNVKFDITIYDSSHNPISNIPVGANDHKVEFVIGINSYDKNQATIYRKLDRKWNFSINAHAVEDWQKTLSTTHTETGYPIQITYQDVARWSGVDQSDPNIIMSSGTAQKPFITTTNPNPNQRTSSFTSFKPNANTKSFDFYITAYNDGTNTPLSASKKFTLTYTETRQEHLNKLNISQTSSNRSTDSNTNRVYTSPSANFGKIDSIIPTAKSPKTLKELQSNSWLTTTEKNVTITVDSITKTTIGTNKWRQSDIKLILGLLGATRTITISVVYMGIDIMDVVQEQITLHKPGWSLTTPFNEIKISGTNNNAEFYLPKSVVDFYTQTMHLDLNWVWNGSKKARPDWLQSGHLDSRTNIYSWVVPQNIFKNTGSGKNQNTIDFGSNYKLKNGYFDPQHLTVQQMIALNTSTQKGFLFKPTKTEIYDIYVDTSSEHMWRGTGTPNGLVALTGNNSDNWQSTPQFIPSQKHFVVEYQVQNLNNNSKSPWETDFNKVQQSLWDQFLTKSDGTKGDYRVKIYIRLKQHRIDPIATGSYSGFKDENYVVSSDMKQELQPSFVKQLLKVINYGPNGTSKAGGNALYPNSGYNIYESILDQINSALSNAPHTHNIDWTIGNAKTNIEKILLDNHLKIKFSTKANPSAADYSATWPNDINYIHANRHFWIQVSVISPTSPNQFTFKLKGNNFTWDLIGTPTTRKTLQSLTGYIPIPTMRQKEITGNTSSPTISLVTSSSSGLLPKGLKYEYSVDGINWTDEKTFKDKLNNNIHITKANFKYRIVVTDATKYILSTSTPYDNSNPFNNFVVTGLSTFIRNSSILSSLASANFKYAGQYGKNQKVLIESPNNRFSIFEMAKLRLKIQYRLSVGKHTNWTDLPKRYNSNGKTYIELDRDLIPAANAPQIEFRLVPFLQDGPMPQQGSVPSRTIPNVSANSALQVFENYTTTELQNPNIVPARPIILPTVVDTPRITDSYFSFIGPTNKNTKDFDILINKMPNAAIQSINVKSETYWNNLVYLFSIDDGSGSSDYAFTKNEFIKWLHGDYAVGSGNALPSVWKLKNNGVRLAQIDMEQGPLAPVNRVPDWNNINMNSLKVQWGTKTTLNKGTQKTNYYISSQPSQVDISRDFLTDVKKWFDTTKIFKAIESVYITGDTLNYVIDKSNIIQSPPNIHTNMILNQYLNPYGLKAQYSSDGGKTWSDNKPIYVSWQDKVKRLLYMRVVPITDSDPNSVFIGDTIYIHNPGSKKYESFATNYKKGKTVERYFKILVTANLPDLSQIKILGNQYHLFGTPEANGVDESLDTNNDDFSYIEVQYYYDGVWYNKLGLLNAIKSNRTPLPGKKKVSLTFPTDFQNGNIQVRWHLTRTRDDAVMSSGNQNNKGKYSKGQYSNQAAADSTNFKDFKNIWDSQEEDVKRLPAPNAQYEYNEPKNNSINPKTKLLDTPDYALTGSLNAATMTFKGIWNAKYFADHKIIVQFSTSKVPSRQLNNTSDWTTSSLTNNIVFTKQAIDNHHKSLWIRFISSDNKFTLSSIELFGNGSTVMPIKIDTSTMKFSITTFSNALKSILATGNTQAGFTSVITSFFDGKTTGIKYEKQVPNSKSLVPVPMPDRKKWVADNGITIRWKVTQTRKSPVSINGKTINNGDSVIFNSLKELQKALAAGTLNFDRSTLRVQWGILFPNSKTNQVTDNSWVKPTDLSKIVNVIYTHDTIAMKDTSIKLTGNTIDTLTEVIDLPLKHIVTGLKLQYSLDNTNWTDKAPASIGPNKKLYVKLAPISGDYELDGLQSADQNTLMDSRRVYIAINIAASQQAWNKALAATNITGHNVEGEWTVNLQPNMPAAEDGQKKGHWEYTLDQVITSKTKWHLKLIDAVSDYQGSNTKGFDNDRDKKYSQRFVLNPNEVTLPGGDAGYVFTDAKGNLIKIPSMQNDVDTSKLIQYIYTDRIDSNIGHNESWQTLGARGKFLPNFIPAVSKKIRRADYKWMQDQGSSTKSDGSSFYGFDVNPYNKKDIMTRTRDNALAPRHAHFEYSFRNTNSSSAWTPWTRNPLPVDRPLESNYKSFRVRIMPDAGYEISDKVFDSDQDGVKEKQSWLREYIVVIVIDTNGITADNATYVGFNDSNNKTGRFKTDDSNGDYSEKAGGNPLFSVKKSGTIWDQYKRDPYYMFEYEVLDSNGNQVAWTDTEGQTYKGWHTKKAAPSTSVPWRGTLPTSLLNGYVVKARIRAKNGFVIDDSQSSGIQPSGFAPYSSEITFAPVKGLLTKLVVPQNYQMYDTKYNLDFRGNTISRNSSMPSVTFGGAETNGTISINAGSLPRFSGNIRFEVQVLRPFDNGTFGFFDRDMLPGSGYNILDNKGKMIHALNSQGKVILNPIGKPTNLKVLKSTIQNGLISVFDWDDDIDYIPNSWTDPSKVNYLQVGDAIRFRTIAKKGFAFKWENLKTTFTDIVNSPKEFAEFGLNRGGILAEKNGANKNVETTPLPVTGLFVIPKYVPSQVKLVYSTQPDKKLNDNAYVTVDKPAAENDRWKYKFRVRQISGQGIWGAPVDVIPTNLNNGDDIEVSIVLKPGYKFGAAYKAKNKPFIIQVQGLKDKIDTQQMARPVISFKGYQGHGEINAIVPEAGGNKFGTTLDKNKLAPPVIIKSKYHGKGVKWEYQVSDSLPASESSVRRLKWTDKAPNDLQVNWYIRARVSTVDPKDVAFPYVYSVPTKALPSNSLDYQKGWTQVTGLKINPKNIDITTEVSGFIGKTIIKTTRNLDSLDESAVNIEFKSQNSKNNSGVWTSSPNSKKRNGLTDLSNKDTYSYKAVAKDGFVFDPKDPNMPIGFKAVLEKGKWALYYDNVNDKDNDWTDIKVEGLQKYLNVEGVSIKSPSASAGKANFIPMGGGTQLINGNVKLTKTVVDGKNTIKDIDNNMKDKNGVLYKDKVGVHYVIQKINLDTGQMNPEFITKKLPTELYNGDIIRVELYSKDPEYKLSSNKSVTIIVNGLSDILPDVEDPHLQFVGESGKGSAFVTNSPPTGYIWEFASSKPARDKDDFVINDAEPKMGKETWNKVPPADLKNGDWLQARLVSTVTGAQVYRPADPKTPNINDPIKSHSWDQVFGLKTIVDLSGLRIKVFNDKSPWDPDHDNSTWNYAFKLDGKQEGGTVLKVNSPIYIANKSKTDAKQLLDIQGHKIKYSDKLAWEFSVDDNAEISKGTKWSKTIPQSLRSTNYVHVRFGIKDGVINYEVKNFRPMTFKVPKLLPHESVNTQTILIVVLSTVGGVGATLTGGTIYFIRARKKVNYKAKVKM